MITRNYAIMLRLDSKRKTFYLSSKKDYSTTCFQGYIFKDIVINFDKEVSFHRSDFRGVLIENCIFENVNFSRCDFVSATIRSCMFISCDFGSSSIINCIIESTEFCENNNFNSDFFRSSFHNCAFQKQKIERAVWRDSVFNDCSFTECSIERSTIEEIIFSTCHFHGLNLSTLAAYDISFLQSNMTNVDLDPDYLGTYLFDKESLLSIKFMYRGEGLDLSKNTVQAMGDLGEYFYSNKRYSESFGIYMIALLLEEKTGASGSLRLFQDCLTKSIGLSNNHDGKQNIKRLAKMALHYLQQGSIELRTAIEIMGVFFKLRIENINIEYDEVLFFGESSLKRFFEEGLYTTNWLSLNNMSSTKAICEVKLNTDDEKIALNFVNLLFLSTISNNRQPYTIIRKRAGSIIFDVLTSAIVMLYVIKFVRGINAVYLQINIDNKVHEKNLMLLENANSSDELVSINKHISENYNSATNITAEFSQVIKILESLKVNFLNRP